MSNSSYSIGSQRLKPVYSAYVLLTWPAQFGRKLVLGTRRNWPRPRRLSPETETLAIFLETRCWYVSRLSRDRDVETETTTLHWRHILVVENVLHLTYTMLEINPLFHEVQSKVLRESPLDYKGVILLY